MKLWDKIETGKNHLCLAEITLLMLESKAVELKSHLLFTKVGRKAYNHKDNTLTHLLFKTKAKISMADNLE